MGTLLEHIIHSENYYYVHALIFIVLYCVGPSSTFSGCMCHKYSRISQFRSEQTSEFNIVNKKHYKQSKKKVILKRKLLSL